jgi:hypothetical protein
MVFGLWYYGKTSSEGEKMTFADSEKLVAMKTYRAHLPGGKVPMCYRLIGKFAEKSDLRGRIVLDYGCGKEMVHVPYLKEIFGEAYVFACDFSLPGTRELCLQGKYDIIIASNVVNVIPSGDGVQRVMAEIVASLNDDGYALINYPTSPRKAGLSIVEMENLMVGQFGSVELMPENLCGKNLVYVLKPMSQKHLGHLLYKGRLANF